MLTKKEIVIWQTCYLGWVEDLLHLVVGAAEAMHLRLQVHSHLEQVECRVCVVSCVLISVLCCIVLSIGVYSYVLSRSLVSSV